MRKQIRSWLVSGKCSLDYFVLVIKIENPEFRIPGKYLNSKCLTQDARIPVSSQRSIGRAKQIAALEEAANLGIEKDKRLPDVEEAIVMFKCGEMEKRKFQIKHSRALLAVVFGKNLKKSASKKILLQELAEQSDVHPDPSEV